MIVFSFQVLSSCRGSDMEGLGLTGDPSSYHYTSQGSCTDLDRKNHAATLAACRTLGFTQAEISTLWTVVAAILHLVNGT